MTPQQIDDAPNDLGRILPLFSREPAGSAAGQTSTHLPHRVQASVMASTRC